MASPIEPSPVLEGEDAERLLEDLKRVCTPEEAKRRIAFAKQWLREMEERVAERADRLVSHRVVVSEPDAAIEVTEVHLTPEARAALNLRPR